MKLAPVPILSVLGLPIHMVQARTEWVGVPISLIRAVLQIERSVNGPLKYMQLNQLEHCTEIWSGLKMHKKLHSKFVCTKTPLQIFSDVE